MHFLTTRLSRALCPLGAALKSIVTLPEVAVELLARVELRDGYPALKFDQPLIG